MLPSFPSIRKIYRNFSLINKFFKNQWLSQQTSWKWECNHNKQRHFLFLCEFKNN